MRALKLSSLLFLLLSGAAYADISSTLTAVSDYDFRGVSLSGKDPAFQPSLDWSSDSGFYAGLWGSSSLDFGPGSESDFEIDAYVGFSGGPEDGLGYDVGIVYYSYWPDDDDVDYAEAWVGGSYGMFSGKLWYTNDYGNLSESAWYAEANAAIPLPNNFGITLHAGYNFGDYWKDLVGDEYVDYSAGVTYTAGHFELGLRWVDSDTELTTTGDTFNNEGRVIFSVKTTLPWSAAE